jgi:hypothetical protein
MFKYGRRNSRKGAQRCRVSKGVSLRLCAFAGKVVVSPALRLFEDLLFFGLLFR